MSGPLVGRSARLGTIALAAALGLALSYIVQRLASAIAGEPAALDVIAQTHIPMFFRVALGFVHAAVLGGLAALLPERACITALGVAPYAVPAIAALLAALALWVP